MGGIAKDAGLTPDQFRRSEPAPNYTAGGNAGFTPWWLMGRHLPGVPEPGR